MESKTNLVFPKQHRFFTSGLSTLSKVHFRISVSSKCALSGHSCFPDGKKNKNISVSRQPGFDTWNKQSSVCHWDYSRSKAVVTIKCIAIWISQSKAEKRARGSEREKSKTNCIYPEEVEKYNFTWYKREREVQYCRRVSQWESKR